MTRGRIIKLGVLLAVAVVVLVGLLLVGEVLDRVTRSSETEDVFTDAAEVPSDLLDTVSWLPDPPELVREMEPETRLDLTETWLRAWSQFSVVADTGDTVGLEVYFAGSALDALRAAAPEMAGRSLEQLSHELRVDFYSADGSIVALEAPATRVRRRVWDDRASGSAVWEETTERYEAVLVLEDGNWRVRHLVRRSLVRDSVEVR